jgi:hypothetical protein
MLLLAERIEVFKKEELVRCLDEWSGVAEVQGDVCGGGGERREVLYKLLLSLLE